MPKDAQTTQDKVDSKQKKKVLKEFYIQLESEKERTEKLLLKNIDRKQSAATMFEKDKESREKYDIEWLSRDLFRRGYQFTNYSKDTKTAVLSTGSQVRIPINLIWAQERIIKNQITSFRPKWEVLPQGKNEQHIMNARYSGKLLDVLFDRLNLRKMIKETVIQGLNFSVGGPWEIGYDHMADNGNGEVYIWLRDPYDFYIDGTAVSLEMAERVHTAVRRPLDEVRTNPLYTINEDLASESRLASSEYKQFLLQALRQNLAEDDEQGGVIVKESWIKTRVTKDNKDELKYELEGNKENTDELRNGEVLLRAITYTDDLLEPMRVRLLRRSEYPFEMYQADLSPLEVYGESWAKHVIPPNKVLNALESSRFEYLYKFAKGRVVLDKLSGVRIIDNKHASIIEKNPGAEVSFPGMPSLPKDYPEAINAHRGYIEDLGGAHDISFGRIPAGVKSGVGIAELKSADSTNQQDLVDNLEDFLTKVGKKVLKEVARNYSEARLIKALGKGGDAEHFAVIGEGAAKKRSNDKQVKIGTDTFDLAKIGEDNEIRVTVGSWLAYTKSAQIDKLKEFFEAGIIDQKTFLEHAEFGDVQTVIENTRKEKILEQYRGQFAGGEQGVSDEEIATQENLMMVQEGRVADQQGVWPLPEDNHEVHKIIHQEYADHPEVSKHMDEHDRLSKLAKPELTDQTPLQQPQPQAQMGAEGEAQLQPPQPTSPELAAIEQLTQSGGQPPPGLV